MSYIQWSWIPTTFWGFFLKTQPRLELKCKHRTQLTKPWSCHAQGVWASPRTQGAPSCGSSLLILPRTPAKYQTRLFLHSLPGSLLQATCNVLSISYETELPPESKLSGIIQYMHLTPLTGGIQGALGCEQAAFSKAAAELDSTKSCCWSQTSQGPTFITGI